MSPFDLVVDHFPPLTSSSHKSEPPSVTAPFADIEEFFRRWQVPTYLRARTSTPQLPTGWTQLPPGASLQRVGESLHAEWVVFVPSHLPVPLSAVLQTWASVQETPAPDLVWTEAPPPPNPSALHKVLCPPTAPWKQPYPGVWAVRRSLLQDIPTKLRSPLEPLELLMRSRTCYRVIVQELKRAPGSSTRVLPPQGLRTWLDAFYLQSI